jgi:hypothetical protein
MKVSETMDYTMLAFSTYFMADLLDHNPQQPPKLSSLFLYFAPPQLRGVCYAGFATSLLYNSHHANSLSNSGTIAISSVMLLTSYFLIFNPNFRLFSKMIKNPDGTWTEQEEKPAPSFSWHTHASDSLGIIISNRDRLAWSVVDRSGEWKLVWIYWS